MEDGDDQPTGDTGDETDAQETAEEGEEEGEETTRLTSSRARDQTQEKKKCCNTRLDELSTPNKRMFLALWNEHAYHLPKEKVKHLKHLLQQLYAMSPEETAKYFAELRIEAKAAAMRKKLKQKLRKYLVEKRHQKQRKRAYKLFKRLLKCGITYAAENPIPPLVSIRLRYLSDIILEQLCDLRKVEMPNRANPDMLGNFLISVADWMAIAVERLYYAAQMSINEITNQGNDETKDQSTFGQPLAASSPKSSFDKGQPLATSTPKSSFDKPLATSTPKGSFANAKPVATSTPKGSFDKPLATSTPKGSFANAKPVATSTPKGSFDKPLATSTPKGSFANAKPVATSTPKGSFDKPLATSTPKGSFANAKPLATSTPKGSFDKPLATSTPKGSFDKGKPLATSTPKGSLDQTQPPVPKRKSVEPYFSLLEERTPTSPSKKPKSKVPYYTFSQMKPSVTIPPNKTFVEMPSGIPKNFRVGSKPPCLEKRPKSKTKKSK